MDIINVVTSLSQTTKISFFEAIMLLCFGISWPISIFKSLRTKIVNGKSPLCMSLIATGYLSGILHKMIYFPDYLVVLYIFNLTMILIDLYLYNRYNLRGTRVGSKRARTRGKTANQKHVVSKFRQKEMWAMVAQLFRVH